MQSWVSYMSFHPLWCWVWLVSLWAMVSHPSRCDLTTVRIDAVVWARMEWWRRLDSFYVMWLVRLESAKDKILGVDTPGQQVPPRVQYGMACLLVSYVVGCVSCLVEWGWLLSLWPVFVTFCVNCLNHMVQKGPICVGNLSSASKAVCQETVAKHDIWWNWSSLCGIFVITLSLCAHTLWYT
jgi:hypothetical protein